MKLNNFFNIAAICAIAAASSCSHKSKVELETIPVEKGDVVEVVTATGTIECVTTVDVGTQVTGIIDKLYADFNSIVKKGELIAEIEKTLLESELTSADANLESARLTYEYNKRNFERDTKLHEKQLISDYDYETSRKDYLLAKSAYTKAQADRVKAAKNLNYAEIYSPIDGIVISREVEVGQTVVSSMNVANLYTIADLSNMQVIADVDEADIGAVHEGQNVTFTVDAFPNDVFTGTVQQVRLSATTTSNVVTYEVVVNADNKEMKLIPGLTANITINVKESRNVLSLPLKALKFEPREFEEAEYLPKAEAMPQIPEGVPTERKDPTIATADNRRLVWVVRNNTLIPVEITMGEDNGIMFEVKSGLQEGDEVALQYNEAAMPAGDAPQGTESPFMPKRPGSDKNKKK
ncbi:MAG: efflux RND transporter periplasmic adaptor subunit [Muribaculaceae bacterium]